MNDEKFTKIILIIFFTFFLFIMIFLPIRGAISSSSYNYTDYCVDKFGSGFIPKNHRDYDLMKCYKIENGEIIEKVFKMSLAQKSAICNDEIGFWELNKWKINNCDWNIDTKGEKDE